MKEQTTNMIKLKFIQNKAVLKITNKTHETVNFVRTEMMGIVDLRSTSRTFRQTLSFRVSRRCM